MLGALSLVNVGSTSALAATIISNKAQGQHFERRAPHGAKAGALADLLGALEGAKNGGAKAKTVTQQVVKTVTAAAKATGGAVAVQNSTVTVTQQAAAVSANV